MYELAINTVKGESVKFLFETCGMIIFTKRRSYIRNFEWDMLWDIWACSMKPEEGVEAYSYVDYISTKLYIVSSVRTVYIQQ